MQPGTLLITGGAARIGRELALRFAELGWNIALHYASSKDAAEATAQELRGFGVACETLQADLLEEEAIAGLVPRARKAMGPLSLLINNASIFEYDNLKTASRESWDRHMMSNLRAPFVLTQAFGDQLDAPVTSKDGRIEASGAVINLIDMRVRKLTPEFMTYTLAKSALWTFTQTAAQALAPRVRVNAIGPGPTIQGHRQSKDHFDRQRAATLLERGSDPEGIVEAAEFIVASKGLTGQLLCIDGGQHLAWKTPDVLGVE